MEKVILFFKQLARLVLYLLVCVFGLICFGFVVCFLYETVIRAMLHM